MADNSSIEWTDATWPVTAGCEKPSPGCKFCYAEVMSGRLAAMAQTDLDASRDPGKKRVYLQVVNQKDGRGAGGYGPKSGWNRKVVTLPERLEEPLRWKKPRRVFVNSMSDLFHRDVPFEFIDRVFAVMALCPQHTFQVLTKRPERMAEYFGRTDTPRRIGVAITVQLHGERAVNEGYWPQAQRDAWTCSLPLPNVWLGTSVEDQQRADERIPHLLRCPAAVRFLSCEPLLGPVDLEKASRRSCGLCGGTGVRFYGHEWKESGPCPECGGNGLARLQVGWESGLDWIIIGGESGHGARPCDLRDIRSLVQQCEAAGVPCFVKQVGARPLVSIDNPNNTTQDTGRLVPGRISDAKGGVMSDWPSDLRVRQMPAAAERDGGARKLALR
jgi:protein gp37